MLRDEQVFLQDVARACEEVLSYTAAESLETYLQDSRTRRAVERCLEIAGEALANLRRRNEPVLADLPGYEKVIGLRNFLIHEYGQVDDTLIWQSVSQELPALLAAVLAKLEVRNDE